MADVVSEHQLQDKTIPTAETTDDAQDGLEAAKVKGESASEGATNGESGIGAVASEGAAPKTEGATGNDSQVDEEMQRLARELGVENLPTQKEEWNPIPVKYDGWMMSHNALRLDQEDLKRITDEVLARRIDEGSTQPWMGANLEVWFEECYRTIHEHHEHEEKIFFPEMAKLVPGGVPSKMSADHKTLMDLLNRSKIDVGVLTSLIKNSAPKEEMEAARAKASASLQAFDQEMRQHLREEEVVGIPLYRANVSIKQHKVIEKQILKDLTPFDLGWFLRPVQDESEKRMWMKQFGGIPTPVISLVLWKAVKKDGQYDRKFTQLLREIESGEKAATTPKGMCTIM